MSTGNWDRDSWKAFIIINFSSYKLDIRRVELEKV